MWSACTGNKNAVKSYHEPFYKCGIVHPKLLETTSFCKKKGETKKEKSHVNVVRTS